MNTPIRRRSSIIMKSRLWYILVWCISVAESRRLNDDMINEVSVNPSTNLAFPTIADEWVQISGPPKPIITATLGSRVEMECEAMGTPPPTLQWLKGNTPLTENESFESNMIEDAMGLGAGMGKMKSRLVINYVLPIHQGIFTCVAEGGSKVEMSETKLLLTKKEDYNRNNFTQLLTSKVLAAHYKPTITLWAPSYFQVIGSHVRLPCRSIGNPKPNVVWYDNEGKIVSRYTKGRVSMMPNGDLRISVLKWSDMGLYNCIAKNSAGEDSVEVFLYPMEGSK